jgi:hypothetical protein
MNAGPYARAVSRTRAILMILAVLAVTALTACGSSDSGGSSAADKPAATSPSTTAAAAASAPTAAAPATTAAPASTTSPANTATVALCRQTYAPFIAEVRHLNHEVTQTITYKSYSAATRKLIKDFVKTDPVPKGPGCQNTVVPPTVQAYFIHLTAAYTWKSCKKPHGCMAQLKAKWRKSRRLTVVATKALNNLKTA